jgi:hypothetical protein
MLDCWVRKGMVFAVIILFIGVIILPVSNSGKIEITSNFDDISFYGYIVNINENQSYNLQTNISNLINNLLNINITIYWTCSNISVISTDLTEEEILEIRFFEKGSFIILLTDDPQINDKATAMIYEFYFNRNVVVYKILQPLNDIQVYIMFEPKIALYSRPTVDCYNYELCLLNGGFLNYEILTNDLILNDALKDDFNVFVHGGMSGGFILPFIDNIKPVTFIAHKKIRKFVENGGGYVGSCFGAYISASSTYHPLCLPMDLSYSPLVNNIIYSRIRITDRPVYRALPGACASYFINDTGITVRIVNSDNPVAFGLPRIIEKNEYLAGPMFLEKKLGESNSKDLAIIEEVDINKCKLDCLMELTLFWKTGLISEETKDYLARYWINYSIGKAIWVTSEFHGGKIVAFGSHPEYMTSRSPPRIVYNAVFYVCSQGPYNVSIHENVLIHL